MMRKKVKCLEISLGILHLRSCLQDRIAKHISNSGRMILVRYRHVIHFVLSEAQIGRMLLKYDLTVVHFFFRRATLFLMGVYSYRFSKVKIAPACVSILNVL